MKNIIFIVSGEKKPIGGNKVVYQCSNFINSQENFSSAVIHLKKKNTYKYFNSFSKIFFKKRKIETGWKQNSISIEKKPFINWTNLIINLKNDLSFNNKRDHIILSEIYAHLARDLLIKKKIPYSIFVQNGYAIMSTNNVKKINEAYQNAKQILTVSKDVKKCIFTLFPRFSKKIINITPLVDYKKLACKKKQNLITYMPRKLKRHSELLIFFLKNYLPESWKIKSLDNLSEKKVYEYLKKSKIFLSFSELEGLGLPPIEAALAGNKVIGYTGEGGHENWREPIFTKVNNGEIKRFCNEVLKNLDKKLILSKNIYQKKKLSIKYSKEKQEKSILKLLRKI